MSRVAVPFKRVEAAPKAICDDTFFIFVSRFPFAVAVTWIVVLGDGDGNVTLKFKVALKTALSVAFPGSATPRTVPLNTRPCENITNVPVEIPEVGTPTEKTPSEFAEHPGGLSTGGDFGLITPAYTPTTFVPPGYGGPPLIANACDSVKTRHIRQPRRVFIRRTLRNDLFTGQRESQRVVAT